MNIFDYANYYKDYNFDEIMFNEIDALIYATLAYLPVPTMTNGSVIGNIMEKVQKETMKGAVAPISIELLQIIEKSKRYKNIQINNVIKKEDEEVQFGAMTFRNDEYTVVAFEGTNASIVGWVENFMLTSEYPTKTQTLAIEYLKDTITKYDEKIYVVGHSKGGNLAMAATMETPDNIFDRILVTYNFDGPGFRKEELETEKFARMNSKTINILPKGSLVGILMNNRNYNYVDAEGIGFKQHYVTSWQLFGQFFIKSKLSRGSTQLMESLQKSVDELKPEDVKKTLEIVMDFFRKNNITKTEDIKYIKLEDAKKMFREIKDVDEKSKELLIQIIRILINPNVG